MIDKRTAILLAIGGPVTVAFILWLAPIIWSKIVPSQLQAEVYPVPFILPQEVYDTYLNVDEHTISNAIETWARKSDSNATQTDLEVAKELIKGIFGKGDDLLILSDNSEIEDALTSSSGVAFIRIRNSGQTRLQDVRLYVQGANLFSVQTASADTASTPFSRSRQEFSVRIREGSVSLDGSVLVLNELAQNSSIDVVVWMTSDISYLFWSSASDSFSVSHESDVGDVQVHIPSSAFWSYMDRNTVWLILSVPALLAAVMLAIPLLQLIAHRRPN